MSVKIDGDVPYRVDAGIALTTTPENYSSPSLTPTPTPSPSPTPTPTKTGKAADTDQI